MLYENLHVDTFDFHTTMRNKLEHWQSQEGPRRALCKFQGQCLTFKNYVKVYNEGHMFKIYGAIGKV